MTDERCETCKFWVDLQQEDRIGACRRYPPQRMSMKEARIQKDMPNSDFPETNCSDWCGEWHKVKGKRN